MTSDVAETNYFLILIKYIITLITTIIVVYFIYINTTPTASATTNTSYSKKGFQ